LKIKPFRATPPATVSSVNPTQTSIPVKPVPTSVSNPTMVVKTAVEAPAIKPSAENRAKIFSSPDFISIRGLAHATAEQKVKEEQSAVADQGPIRDFNIEEFEIVWKEYADTRLNNNMQAQTAFKFAALTKTGDRTIRVAFPSETAIMFFTDVRSTFSEYLRNEASLPGIEFELDTLKHAEIKLSTKSDKEKFEAMRDKNPALEELRKRFNLQIDF
jgi:DNA polymerase III subunit gamma/tau